MTTAAQYAEREEAILTEIADLEEAAELQRKLKSRPRQLHAELNSLALKRAKDEDMAARGLEVAAVELHTSRREALEALEAATKALTRLQKVRQIFDDARRQANALGVEPKPEISQIAVGASPERKRIITEFNVAWTRGVQ
jgi:hypothetical protein